MTPQERQLVDDLFERLARLETAPRDADAERAIAEGLQRAPNAVYALVQTVLVQDEALKRADARIRELTGEAEPAPAQGGFLDSMRAMFSGQPARTSVPSVGAAAADPRYGGYAAGPATGGSSFLGTAAASAAGMIGGALLLNSISSMFGHRGGGSAFAASPWDQQNLAGSDLSRDAGYDDIGGGNAPQGSFDPGGADQSADGGFDSDFGDAGGDFGGGDFGSDA
jgi:hypothetical protein